MGISFAKLDEKSLIQYYVKKGKALHPTGRKIRKYIDFSVWGNYLSCQKYRTRVRLIHNR